MSLSESVALLYLVHERGGDTPIVVVTAKPVNCELSGGVAVSFPNISPESDW